MDDKAIKKTGPLNSAGGLKKFSRRLQLADDLDETGAVLRLLVDVFGLCTVIELSPAASSGLVDILQNANADINRAVNLLQQPDD